VQDLDFQHDLGRGREGQPGARPGDHLVGRAAQEPAELQLVLPEPDVLGTRQGERRVVAEADHDRAVLAAGEPAVADHLPVVAAREVVTNCLCVVAHAAGSNRR
jgi:hypothetical protein